MVRESNRKRLANHLRVAAKTALPELVTQDYNLRATIYVFLGREGTTEHRRDAERRKKIGGDDSSRHSLGLSAPDEINSIGVVGADLFKCLRMVTPFQKISACGGIDNYEPVGVTVRERPQQYRIHDAKDRSVHPDPQRQRQHGDKGEAGMLHQHSRAVAQVLS
jgi:hypothetical protein